MYEYRTIQPVGRRRCPPGGSTLGGFHLPGHPPGHGLRGLARQALGALVRPRVRSALALVALFALVGAGLMPAPAAAQRQGGGHPRGAPQPPRPTPRPGPAIGLRDLPPGYEEAPSLQLLLNDAPLDDRVLRQTAPGPGPGWIWTMTYQGSPPVTQERVDFLAEDLAIFLMRELSDVAEISNW